MRKPPPDFVIVGAPKCATTAVYKTLQQHPGVYFPKLKEPQYFAFEHTRGRAVEKESHYDSLYKDAPDDQLRGDASVLYLSSRSAIPAIIKRRPDAKFIALVRDPVDMFVSWHNECLKALDEDEKDPERAWRLQAERAAGQNPHLCKEPSYLQYLNICSVGSQIQRLCEIVPPGQRLVVVLENLDRTPAAIHRQITEFLGIETIHTPEFLRENVFSSHRIRAVAMLVRLVHVSPFLKGSATHEARFQQIRGVSPHLGSQLQPEKEHETEIIGKLRARVAGRVS